MKRLDALGDRLKTYERAETAQQFIKGIPVYARIDGRSFHNFTKGMQRPYDENFSMCIDETAKYLIKETGADIGYVQSDEISLCWYQPNLKSDIFFAYKKQKMVSTLAALASVKFFELAQTCFTEKVKIKLPTFDCRVFQVPNETELMNCFLWRYQDAIKNSVQMLARTYFSHRELQNKNTQELKKMLFDNNTPWENMPTRFKEGSFFKNVPVQKMPDVYRNIVVDFSMYSGVVFGELTTEDRIKFILKGATNESTIKEQL